MIPDAMPPVPESTTTEFTVDPDKTAALKPAIIEAVSTVFDPEIPVNIWELGLIYDIAVDGSAHALVTMTLTAPGCPAAQSLPAEVESEGADGGGDCRRKGRRRVGTRMDKGPDVGRREATARPVVNLKKDLLYAATLQESRLRAHGDETSRHAQRSGVGERT